MKIKVLKINIPKGQKNFSNFKYRPVQGLKNLINNHTDRAYIFMAIFSSSTFGTISGRHGTAVAAVDKRGNATLRLYRKPSNPNSPKQLAHRMKFGLINKELSPLREVIKMGYKDTDAFSKVVSKSFGEVFTGEYPDFEIDFSKLRLAAGKLQSVEKVTAKLSDETFGIDLSWDTTVGFQSTMGSESDTVNVVCYNKNTQLALTFNNVAKRGESSAVIALPEIWKGSDIHCWVYLTSTDDLFNSNSVYVSSLSL